LVFIKIKVLVDLEILSYKKEREISADNLE